MYPAAIRRTSMTTSTRTNPKVFGDGTGCWNRTSGKAFLQLLRAAAEIDKGLFS